MHAHEFVHNMFAILQLHASKNMVSVDLEQPEATCTGLEINYS